MSKRKRPAKMPQTPPPMPPTADEQVAIIKRAILLRQWRTRNRVSACLHSAGIYLVLLLVDWVGGQLIWWLYGPQFAALPTLSKWGYFAQVGFALLTLISMLIHSAFALVNLIRIELAGMREEGS